MRKLIPVFFALALAGCAANSSVVTPTNLVTFEQDVQAAAVAACGFLPTAETVAGIIATGNPIVTTAGAVANAICFAVAPAKAAHLAGRQMAVIPSVAGVIIHGKFVR
jgi:hypothetical protein